ncbi:hypothetical protein LCGC14_0141570 [marine sediment metagenome]|uniref:Phage tail tape measure protein domain-containing protein n=1 Tax=marine sediment metagenome TaxID=412755 RepID=A0A0F9VGF9_9ZZZZ
MAQPFILDVILQIQKLDGLDVVKQQLAGIQVGGIGQTGKLAKGLKNVGIQASTAAIHVARGANVTIKMGNAAKKTGSQLKGAGKAAKGFGDQILLAGKRYGAFLGATVVAFKAFQLIGSGTRAVIEFDQAIVSLSQILDKPIDQLQELSKQFLDLSVTTGTSAKEIAEAAKLLAQAGFRGSELTEAISQLAKVPLTPIFENMDQAVDGAIAALRQFSDEGLTVESVFDKIINVSNKYAASFPDIIEGLKRGGSAFQAIGGTLDEFIAAFTTIRSVTRESASSVGTSLKTLSSRLADPKIIKFLETKNIRVLEEGQFVGPLEAIRRIGDGLERQTTIQDKINIATKLGGRRQISRFLAVAQNAEKTDRILEDAKNSSGAFSKVADQGLQAIGKQIDILVAKAQKLAIDLGADLFIPFIEGLTGAAEGAIALLGALKPILPLISKIGAVLAGGAIIKGLGSFIGPRLGQLAGPAAFAAAGGGRKGISAGIGASPFAQAGLLIAASETAAALVRTADGADSFTASLISSIGAITAAIALFRGQTIAQFATGGGLFKNLGKLGKLGALAGTAATIGTIALPLIIGKAQDSAQELTDRIIESARKAISNISLDAEGPNQVSDILGNLYQEVGKGIQEFIKSADPLQDPSLSKSLAGIGRALSGLFEGDFEAVFGPEGSASSRGGLSSKQIQKKIEELIGSRPKLVEGLIDSVAQTLIDTGKTKRVRGNARQSLITQTIASGRTPEAASVLVDAIIKAAGGLDKFNDGVRNNINTIQTENIAREKTVALMRNFIPTKVVGQLLSFSKAVDKTTRIINTSAKLFQSQIAEIAGGIRAPKLDFDFGSQQVENLIKGGGLKDLFAFTPDIPSFVGAFDDIDSLLSRFITSVSDLPTGLDFNVEDIVDQFFKLENIPAVLKDKFADFFDTTAQDIRNVAEGKFISADEIKQRFQKEFENLGVGTTDAVVESVVQFMNSTFTQIEDELNRLATVRQFELDIAVRPGTQARFLEQQLQRVGVSTGGRGGPVREARGSIAELDLIRRERETRGAVGVPGLLPTPEEGFFQGPGQRLADIVGDERIRAQLRDQFKELITESSVLKRELSNLKPGSIDFIKASEDLRELSRSTIELQTAMEAASQATQQSLEIEKRTLTLQQGLETAQAQARGAELVRQGRITPLQADRRAFDLTQRQAEEQRALQDKFDGIIEKDNALRADLAKTISINTKSQAEIVGEFSMSTNIFSEATRIQFSAAELMAKNISDFGQRITSTADLTAGSPPTTFGGFGPAAASRPVEEISQQSTSNTNEKIQENTNAQRQSLEVLKAIFSRQQELLSRDLPPEDVRAAGRKVGDIEFSQEAIENLAEKIENLETAIREPSEIKLVSDQRVEIDLSTLPSDVVNEVRPIFEEAALKTASIVTRKALESLAANSQDSEISIAATNTAQELV